MFRKFYFVPVLFIALFAMSSISTFAQGRVTGMVLIKKGDAEPVPFQGAKVDCYRIDIKQKCRSTKTNKRGEFLILGMPWTSKVVLAVSGEGVSPIVSPDITPSDKQIKLLVQEGNGEVFTEDRVREILKEVPAPTSGGGKISKEDKAAIEAREKEIADIKARNEKKEEKNKLRIQYLKEGEEAFKSKDWGLAIEKFGAGYDVDPTYLGSAPLFLNNKAIAIKQKTIQDFNAAVNSKDKPRIRKAQLAIVSDFADSLELVNKAANMLKNGKADESINAENIKKGILLSEETAKDTYVIMGKINVNLASYLSSEEDSARAVKIYKDSLTLLPKNPDVIAGIGLALFSSSGYTNKQEEKQEALNYMAYYMKEAPKGHSMRAAIKGLMDFLVGDEKMKPQALKK